MTVAQANFLKNIPSLVDTNITLGMIKTGKVGPQHLQAIKDLTLFNDEKISDWLDISVKTFRSYKKPHTIIQARIKEHSVMALSLIKHGIEVFGTTEKFSQWLEKENFFLIKRPLSNLWTRIAELNLLMIG